jgi:hypothetical protein
LRMQQAVCRSRIRVASMSAPIRVSGFMHGLYLAPRWIRSAWENFKNQIDQKFRMKLGGVKQKRIKTYRSRSDVEIGRLVIVDFLQR